MNPVSAQAGLRAVVPDGLDGKGSMGRQSFLVREEGKTG